MKKNQLFRKRRGWVQVILHARTGGGGGSVDSWKLQHWVHSRVRAAWLGLNKTLTPASNWAGMAPLGALLREICRIYGLHKYAELRHVHLINRNIIIINLKQYIVGTMDNIPTNQPSGRKFQFFEPFLNRSLFLLQFNFVS